MFTVRSKRMTLSRCLAQLIEQAIFFCAICLPSYLSTCLFILFLLLIPKLPIDEFVPNTTAASVITMTSIGGEKACTKRVKLAELTIFKVDWPHVYLLE